MNGDLRIALIAFLNELESARRACRLNPPDHPGTREAEDRVQGRLGALAEAGTTTIGITDKSFLWHGSSLQLPSEAPARRLREILFRLGLAALRFDPADGSDGVVRLARLLSRAGEEPGEVDRLSILEARSELTGVDLLAIEATELRLVESAAVAAQAGSRAFWNQIALRLVERGSLPWSGNEQESLTPEGVVEALEATGDSGSDLETVFHAIGATLVPSARRRDSFVPVAVARTFLSELLALLSQERRSQVIITAAEYLPLDLREPPDAPTLVDLTQVLDAVEQFLDHGDPLPAAIRSLVQRIAHRPELRDVVGRDTTVRATVLLARIAPTHGQEVGAINRSAATIGEGWSERPWARELSASMETESTRRHLVLALGEIVSLWPLDQVADKAVQRLADELVYALEACDLSVASRIAPLLAAAPNPFARRAIAESTIEAAVKALATLEEEQHAALTAILAALGEDALPAILAALAEAEEVSTRSHLLEAVLRQRSRAIQHVRPLLDDDRWYVVRNAIFLLRRLHDPELPSLIRGRFAGSNPQVLVEILKGLIAADDPRWLPLLLRAVDDPDHDRAVAATALAGKVPDPRVVDALVARLGDRTGMRLRDPLTIELINALGEHRNPASLPALARVLSLRPWMYPFSISTIRAAATAAVAAVDSPEARRMAGDLARDPDPAVARAAAESPAAGKGEP